MTDPAVFSAFSDELQKIAISWKHMGKQRQDRRPMSVHTLLRKEKEGTLYKHTKTGQVASDQSSLFYSESDPKTGKPATTRKKKGEVPSREGMDTFPKSEARQDQRLGTDKAMQLNEPAYANQPAEHGNY